MEALILIDGGTQSVKDTIDIINLHEIVRKELKLRVDRQRDWLAGYVHSKNVKRIESSKILLKHCINEYKSFQYDLF